MTVSLITDFTKVLPVKTSEKRILTEF